MATELGKAYVQIIPSARGIEGSISKQLKGESSAAGKSAGRGIVGALKGVIIAAGIGKVLVSTIQEGGKLQQSLGGIETLFKNNAEKVKQYADEAYKTTGLSANAYMESVTSFSASLLQSLDGDTAAAAEKANTAMVDMSDNANKMGTSMEMVQNAYQGFAKQNYTMLDNLKLGYGGTKTEMQRLLDDATKLSGIKYDIGNLSDVYDAIHVIQGELGITGTTAKEASETISGSFLAMKGAFQNTLGSLALGENIEPALTSLATTVSTFLFKNLIPMIGNILASLPKALMAFGKAMVPELLNYGRMLLTNVGSGIAEGYPEILQNGVDMILNFANGIMEKAPAVIDNIGVILVNVYQALIDAAPVVLEKGAALVTGLAKGIWDNLPAVIESITNILFNLIQVIVKKAPDFYKKGFAILGKMAKGIWDNLPEAITVIGNILKALIQKIIELLPQVLKVGGEILLELGKGIWNALPDILAKIPEIITAIVNAIVGLGGELVQAGKDLMAGLARGIGESIGDVVAKAQSAASNVIDSVKNTFGIKSPSRVFMGIGQYLNLGLAKGISDNVAPVTRAIDDLGAIAEREFIAESSILMNSRLAGSTELVNLSNVRHDEKNMQSTTLALILEAINDLGSELPAELTEAIRALKLEINNREFGRLVKSV